MTNKNEIVNTAITWWRNLKPDEWTQEQHFDNPGVNTCTDTEYDLAIAVAQYLQSKEEKP